MDTFNLATYRHVQYELNPITGYYQKTIQQTDTMPVNALPYELRREITRGEQIKCNATECLARREYKKENGSKRIFTGLLSVNFDGWYIGDTYRMLKGQKLKSLLLFYFSEDHSSMDIYYFSGYYKHYPEQRQEFARQFIQHINSK